MEPNNNFSKMIAHSFAESMKPIIQAQNAYAKSLGSILQTNIVSQEMIKSIEHLQEQISQTILPSVALEGIYKSLDEFSYRIKTAYFDSLPATQAAEIVARSFRENLKNISWLSDDTFQTVQDFVDSISALSDNVLVPSETSEPEFSAPVSESEGAVQSENNVSNTIALLNLIFMIIFGILTLAQNHYWNSKNALDAQKQQLSNDAYEEQSLQIENEKLENEKRITSIMEDIAQSLENIAVSSRRD